MKKLFLLPIFIMLCACGVIRNAEVRQMSAGQVSQIDDETLCQDARRMVVLREHVPVTVIRELQKRNLEACMESNGSNQGSQLQPYQTHTPTPQQSTNSYNKIIVCDSTGCF